MSASASHRGVSSAAFRRMRQEAAAPVAGDFRSAASPGELLRERAANGRFG